MAVAGLTGGSFVEGALGSIIGGESRRKRRNRRRERQTAALLQQSLDLRESAQDLSESSRREIETILGEGPITKRDVASAASRAQRISSLIEQERQETTPVGKSRAFVRRSQAEGRTGRGRRQTILSR